MKNGKLKINFGLKDPSGKPTATLNLDFDSKDEIEFKTIIKQDSEPILIQESTKKVKFLTVDANSKFGKLNLDFNSKNK